MRPPIEKMKEIWLRADRESFQNEIAICDYALELEARLTEIDEINYRLAEKMGWKEIFEANRKAKEKEGE